jgi:hypothetical protein
MLKNVVILVHSKSEWVYFMLYAFLFCVLSCLWENLQFKFELLWKQEFHWTGEKTNGVLTFLFVLRIDLRYINTGYSDWWLDFREVMPPPKYLMQTVWFWCDTCPNLFIVPWASVCCEVRLGKHSGLRYIQFKMDNSFSTILKLFKQWAVIEFLMHRN